MTIYYNFCDSGNISPKTLYKGGINFISLVNMLEKQGYRIKINVMFISITENEMASFTINVKQHSQKLNLLKLSFPLVHPSMLRRFAFKWLETSPDIKNKTFSEGYGVILDSMFRGNGEKERRFLKDNNIVKGENVYYTTVKECYRVNTVSDLMKTMNIKL